ncbi:MAG: YfcE family phosphodiesterase, partial [Asgard group archaeon]|nr:YfcE family phosphodiesterase [Asgard group archaeon]
EKPVFEIYNIKFGVFHGTGIYPRGDAAQLKQVAEEMNVDVLLTGHSHLKLVHNDKEHLILNPGTSSGASGGSSWTVDTGLIILTILPERKISIDSYIVSRRKLIHKRESKKIK